MPSVTRVRVRYKDTDTMSVVNERVHLPVVEAFVKYVKPGRLDDLLEITPRVSECKRASFRFSYEIHNETKELLATGHTVHACWNPATAKMIPIPDWLKEIMPDADLDPVTP